MLMPFGQYKGWELNEIPISYLLWLSEEADIYGQLKWEVAATLDVLCEERDRKGAEGIGEEDRKRLVTMGVSEIREWWKYYQKVFKEVFFGVELLPPAFKTERSRRYMGYWALNDRVICISNNYILPQERFENILVHEMCHQYITDMGIVDTSPHGKRWRNIAAKISEAIGNRITIYDEYIYAPNNYQSRGDLVILPVMKKPAAAEGGQKLTSDEVENSYGGFIEELSNM